jgi:hypothetical protein
MTASNDILVRFQRVRGRLRAPFSMVVAGESGGKIVFRTGLGCAIFVPCLGMGAVLGGCLIFATNVFEKPPSRFAWVLLSVMAIIMLSMTITYVREGSIHFVIDSNQAEILIPTTLGGARRIPLERIEFFLGCSMIDSERIYSVLYAVNADGGRYQLTEQLGPGGRLLDELKCLGFICAKPSLMFQGYDVDGVPKEKEQLLRAARVVYDSDQADSPLS